MQAVQPPTLNELYNSVRQLDDLQRACVRQMLQSCINNPMVYYNIQHADCADDFSKYQRLPGQHKSKPPRSLQEIAAERFRREMENVCLVAKRHPELFEDLTYVDINTLTALYAMQW